MADDPIVAAIAATEDAPLVRMFSIKGNLPTGRPFELALPTDITPVELIGFVGFLTGGGLVEMYQNATETPMGRARAAGLHLPGDGVPS